MNRTTAYNKTEKYSVILGSYGAFDAIWQFSSYLIAKGFSIFSVGNQDKFSDGNMPKVTKQTTKLIVRANGHGKPQRSGNKISVNDKYYMVI